MPKPFKEVFDEKFILKISNLIVSVYPKFDSEAFILKTFNPSYLQMELKQRIRFISTNLGKFLPTSYKDAIEILLLIEKEIKGFEGKVLQDFVEVYGLNDFKTSMKALQCFTIDSTSEFAIRHFILKYEDKTMQQMQKWAQSSNIHLRRLSSEGCRPRLPWGISLKAFKTNPSKVFQILNILKYDKELYVKKSVANNLNDISKDHPKEVIQFIQKNINQNKDLDWVLKHGARTLLKQSNEEVLELFGFNKSDVLLSDLKFDSKVVLGQALNFSFKLNSKESLGKLRVEYSIDLLRQKNKKINKVFHISESVCQKQQKEIFKSHSFKKVTTRNYYAGSHTLYIIVNGKRLTQFDFELI